MKKFLFLLIAATITSLFFSSCTVGDKSDEYPEYNNPRSGRVKARVATIDANNQIVVVQVKYVDSLLEPGDIIYTSKNYRLRIESVDRPVRETLARVQLKGDPHTLPVDTVLRR